MTGRRPTGLVLQPRDRVLLEALDTMRVIDREQARQVGRFGSVTRTNTRLLKLVAAGLLTRLAVGTTRGGHQFLYARTREGAAVVRHLYRIPPWNAHSPIVAGQPLLEHQLRVNRLYLALQGAHVEGVELAAWRTFRTAPMPAVANLIPDALAIVTRAAQRRAFFVEVDLATEPLRTWMLKVERYLRLAHSRQFETVVGETTFGVAVVVPSRRRLDTVRGAIATKTDKLFFLTTFDAVDPRGIAGRNWWRPTGHEPVALI